MRLKILLFYDYREIACRCMHLWDVSALQAELARSFDGMFQGTKGRLRRHANKHTELTSKRTVPLYTDYTMRSLTTM